MTALPVSPLAPARFPELPAIAGVEAAAGSAGLYKHRRDDVWLVRLCPGARAAGVFTTNAVGSAPTDWSKAALATSGGAVRGLLVNAGCANSFTGPVGYGAAERSLAAAAEAIGGADPRELMAASTGVIGVPLDDAKVRAALPAIGAALAPADWLAGAKAIMTTDTFPKGSGAVAKIDGVDVALAGIAKGSGMIAPNMATMLAFVFTDANLSAPVLRALLTHETAASFNKITVDADRSTNDCVFLFATGMARHDPVMRADDPRLDGLRAAFAGVMRDLALQIVRDGEGATKFVTVRVSGAVSDASAARIARVIAESPLVKTAIAGEDANWGRIVMAVGRADEPIVKDKVSVRFGSLWAAKDGMAAPDYSEAAMSAYMKKAELDFSVVVGEGQGSAEMYTCDLTKRYVEINGDYRS
jgi:glutamate N-acetyltransferase/amino-acid N-acetyltransferase